jgi:eukaryotic-like serine/threonine-protein kinase
MERIGKYEIIRQLGEGSTSSVYLGFDPFAQREVAIKHLHRDSFKHTDKAGLYHQLLLNEAALAGRLEHPHIARIHDAVIEDGDAYVVMEYVAGGTLEPYTRPDNLLAFERLVEIIFKCSRALDYAFHQGVIHRDIKPANILLTSPKGQDIKISDFGAALFTATETTQLCGIGSPAYMSPEQVREQPLDQRTDIYSLGVVMYQLLTGHLPFEADSNVNMLYQIAHHEPPAPSSLRPAIPPELEAIALKAMRKNPRERYASWAEFSHDLAQAYRHHNLDQSVQPESAKFERLRSFRFFREFSDVEIWEVVRFGEWRQVPANTFVMREGDTGDHFCVVLEGQLQILKNEHLLGSLKSGDCFGEMALFTTGRGARTASVRTLTESRVMIVRTTSLLRASSLCQKHFYKGFLEVLVARLDVANTRISNL